MTEPSPAIRALKAELSQAIRRDHSRRTRRRRALRAGSISVLALAALSSAALAAGGAFREVETVTPVGEVELPRDVTIQAVDSFPEFVGRATPNGFATSTSGVRGGHYIYHVTGGEAREIGCGFATHPTNNIYITSTRQLSEHEIRLLLRPDGELEGHAKAPPWITSESNGCPNPGIAGQPGIPNGPLLPGKAAVAVPTSTTTHILIRTKTAVPIVPPTSTTPTP
ncbi:MAG TPA: hypothetical protein VNY52_09675, partial [Solirubrobacteraceae bacterium]|nr:hypothetical protein [Solirubrobacteraceae bacterium]